MPARSPQLTEDQLDDLLNGCAHGMAVDKAAGLPPCLVVTPDGDMDYKNGWIDGDMTSYCFSEGAGWRVPHLAGDVPGMTDISFAWGNFVNAGNGTGDEGTAPHAIPLVECKRGKPPALLGYFGNPVHLGTHTVHMLGEDGVPVNKGKVVDKWKLHLV